MNQPTRTQLVFDSLKIHLKLTLYVKKPSLNIILSLLSFQAKFEQFTTQLDKPMCTIRKLDYSSSTRVWFIKSWFEINSLYKQTKFEHNFKLV